VIQPGNVGGEAAGPRIARRLGSTPRERGSSQGMNCPDVFELASGDFAIIGTDQSSELDGELPGLNASRATYERTIVIPRQVLMHALEQLNQES
jgi:hypothetical protein